MSKLYASITNTSNILSVELTDSHTAACATAIVTAETTSLGIGDSISINLGYTTNHAVLFTGYVKSIEIKEPNKLNT